MSDFQTNKKLKLLPLPYIGMYDLDLIYQTSDVELLYQILSKVNEIAQSQNIIIDNFEKILDWVQNQIEQYTKEQLQEWLNDGTLENMIMALGKVVKYFDTTEEMIQSQNLQVGQVVKTLGFSNINDGGKGIFKITDEVDSNNFQFSIGNGKYATLLYDDNLVNTFGLLPNNTISSQTLIKIANLYKKINFGIGTYILDDTIIINDIRGIEINGKGCHFTTIKINNSKECIIITNSPGDTENTSCIVHDLHFNADKGLILDTCQLSQLYNLDFTCFNKQIVDSVGLCIRNNSHLNKCRNIKITNYETGLSISPTDHIVSNINECENIYIDYCLTPFDINGSRNVVRDSDIEGYNGASNFNSVNGKLINVSFERNIQGNWLNIGKHYNELDISSQSSGGGLANLPLATITGNYNKLKVCGGGYTIANITGEFNEIFFNGYRTIESQYALGNYTPTTKFKTIGAKNIFELNDSNLSTILKGSGFTLNGNQVICNNNDNNIYLDIQQYNITVGYFIVDFEVQAGGIPNFNFTRSDGSRIFALSTPKRLVCMYAGGLSIPNIPITGMVNTGAFTFKSLYISQDNPSKEMLDLLIQDS